MTGNLSVDGQARYEFIRRLLTADFSPPAAVIELGAAPGDQIAAIAELGYQATAVDIGVASDAWSDGNSGRMAKLLERAGVALIEWDLEESPYPLLDGVYDAVVMTEVYEHLRDYPVKSLIEIRRILRPGGRLYFTTPNSAYVMNRLRLLLGRNVATPLPDWIGGLPHARHAREYTVSEIVELFRYADLRVRLVSSRHFHRHSGQHQLTDRVLKSALDIVSRVRPSLGATIIVVAERSE